MNLDAIDNSICYPAAVSKTLGAPDAQSYSPQQILSFRILQSEGVKEIKVLFFVLFATTNS